MDRFDPFVKYADVYGDIINWEKDPMNKPQNQNKYFFSDGKTYYEQICKMLRLMSVFKEAFNQIYSNEDEISEAWENFVNNLSASVVEGSEPDVTLTWTDDSVNFEFTMVPGVPGEQGVGITSISFNSNYTMTITLSDGNTYTSMSLKGETGPQGPQGETGSGLQILDVYATLADLQSAHPTGQPGDAYQVGSGGNYILYIWSSSQSAWVQAGTLGTVSPYTSAPLMDGTASAGSQNLYARGDHVHPSDTSRASWEELDALIKTSQALIDQSFTYRESPAIQDGLARIDKIKGNTLVWNQIAKANEASRFMTVSDGIVTLTGTPTGNFDFMENTIKHDQNHVYLFLENTIANPNNIELTIGMGSGQPWVTDFGTVGSHSRIYRSSYTTKLGFYNVANKDISGIKFTCNIFDLTAMFGAGNEPATLEEFTSLFHLPHYDFNEGSLLNFNGSGIKITGKNQLNPSVFDYDAVYEYSEGGNLTVKSSDPRAWTNVSTFHLKKGNYIFTRNVPNGICDIRFGYENFATSHLIANQLASYPFTVTKDTDVKIKIGYSYPSYPFTTNAMIRFADADSTFEAYSEITKALPTLPYFPTGMKKAGNAYDELTDLKAIARIGQIDLGDLVWRYGPANTRFEANMPSNYKTPTSVDNRQNMICDRYPTNSNPLTGSTGNGITGYQDSILVYVKDESFTDVSAFTNAVTGSILYYEMATPAETAVDLDLDFMAYEDGTEQLLPVNGSVPSTSPIMADMTYLSIDDAMEYVLEKLANVPENIQQILESLEDDVADLQTDVGALQPAVTDLQTSVGNINTNIGQLSSTVAGHTASISDIQSDITDISSDVSDLGTDVSANTGMINQLTSSLASTDGRVSNLSTSVSGLESTVTAQGTTVTALGSIIQDISNNPVSASLGQHELGLVAAYVDATLPANTGTMVTIPKPTIFPSNYTPLFIVGMSTGSYNVSICEIPPTFGNRDSINCRVWNHGSQQTTQITVYILCMRQRQSQ